MIINQYRDKEPIFDIAAVESTSPGGTRKSFNQNGKNYYVLADDYSRDGGHLNDLGKKVVAEQFLIFLARLSEHK
jgi:lysophospholipase L1-like esterase